MPRTGILHDLSFLWVEGVELRCPTPRLAFEPGYLRARYAVITEHVTALLNNGKTRIYADISWLATAPFEFLVLSEYIGSYKRSNIAFVSDSLLAL